MKFHEDLKPFCNNGGEAQESGGVWSCSCDPQFTGSSCEAGKCNAEIEIAVWKYNNTHK